jgi:flagella basal body P-ring formation protein FlgA
MYNNNQRPLSLRKRINVVLGLTILAWATQTLLTQWARGAEPAERFASVDAMRTGATLEIRKEATVIGAEVRLRNICRWSNEDETAVQGIADLTLARLDDKTPFVSITLPEIKMILQQAGANLGTLNFVGSATCSVNRSDVGVEKSESLEKWIEAKTANPSPALVTTPKSAPAILDEKPEVNVQSQTLRQLLKDDLATRLHLKPADMQFSFKPLDDAVLDLSSELFQFHIDPFRVKNLGPVAWDVTVVSGNSNKKVHITGNARAWQTQTVLTRPVAYQQVITADDLEEQRTLVENLDSDPLVAKDNAVNQQASRDLKPGTVLTGKMLDPVQLVKAGQLILVDAKSGGVVITSTVRAIENGTFGQAIKVKNDATKETLVVTITGPQRAELRTGGNITALMARK